MDRHIRFEALHNFRDLGGYTTTDGHRIRPARLYRTDSLGKLSPGTPDWSRFLSLGIRTVIDLRYPGEIENSGRIPDHPSFTYHNLSIEHRPYNQVSLASDVAPGPYLSARYLEVAQDGTKEIRSALELVAKAAESDTPLAFHCAKGKDRTGLLAALILGLLGVPDETIIDDFTLTELAAPALLADWKALNNGRNPTWPGFNKTPPEVMRLFLSSLADQYGGIAGYISEALSLNPGPLSTTLRNGLLEERSEQT